jgi:predicted PurR-regulated permease PerM
MNAEAETPPTIIETATRVEQHRREEIRRYVMLTLVIVTVLFLFALVSNLIAYQLLHGLIEDVEKQNSQQLVALEENRQAALRNDAAQDRILVSIGDRLVPRSEVRRLQSQVVALRKQARTLRQSIRRLNVLLASGAAGGG